jgi:hypothetical protein
MTDDHKKGDVVDFETAKHINNDHHPCKYCNRERFIVAAYHGKNYPYKITFKIVVIHDQDACGKEWNEMLYGRGWRPKLLLPEDVFQ